MGGNILPVFTKCFDYVYQFIGRDEVMQDGARLNTILTTFNLNIYENFANVLTDRPGNFLHLNPIENV